MATSFANRYSTEDEELDMRWESFLNGKRDDVRRQGNPALHVMTSGLEADQRDENVENPAHNKRSHHDERDDSIAEPTKDPHAGVDMFKVFEMFRLVEKGNWGALVKHVKKNPQSVFVRMTQGPNGSLTLSSKGNLLLHEVCRFDPSLELVNVLINMNNTALKTTGEHGRLPLHFACACGASAEIVQRLIIAYPSGTKIRDGADLMLPLHLACKWGSSKAVLKALVAANPEGRKVRDIYAKLPMDYAKTIASPELREASIACLQSNVRRVTFQNRATLFKNNATIADLQQENQELANENKTVKSVQIGQEAKLKALEEEYVALQSLQADSNHKKNLLERKLEVLVKANEVKQELIERLEKESSAKYEKELKEALKGQEEKYKQLLKTEQERVADLQRRAKEIEITHRMYTNAILEEHDREAADFEMFTMQFQHLEAQLRAKLSDAEERTDFLEIDLTEKTKKFKEMITGEREKVAFLESHVTKVNSLLESEQKRFQELEEILKQTIAVENEQRDELVEEFTKKEEHYKSMLKTEKDKVAAMEQDYEQVRHLLKHELERVSAFQARENELKHLVELQQRKIRELKSAEEVIEAERQKSQRLQASESQTKAQLAAEQDKVKLLETKLRAVQNELEAERATVEQLRAALEEKQAEFEEEKKKVRTLQKTQANKRQVLDSLHQKVAILEEALAESKSIADQENKKLKSVLSELDQIKKLLEEERDVVEDLHASKKQLTQLLEGEKQKVRNLEQAQVIAEAEMYQTEDGNDVDAASHAKLLENQKKLKMERARVANLKEEQSQLNSILETKSTKLEALEARLNQKEAELRAEKQKSHDLEKQKAETEDILKAQQERASALEQEHLENQERLEEEKRHIRSLEIALIEAKSHIESVEGKMNTLGAVKKGVHESFTDIEKQKLAELETMLTNYKIQLEAEQDLVQELELELSEAKSLCNAEKRKVLELKEAFDKASDDLQTEKRLVDSLEQDRARKNVIIESEQNKVKALEHARDQLQALLEWEKANLKSHLQKHNDVERRLHDAEHLLRETTEALTDKTFDVEDLTKQIESLGELRKEVVRLNAETRQRDVLLAMILKAAGNDKTLSSEESFKEAKRQADHLKRIIGLDLAGLDDEALMQGGALVVAPRRDLVTMRRIRRTLFWTIPLIPIIAISQDPSLLQDITASLDPQMLQQMTAQFAAISSNLDPTMLRDMTRDFASNMARNFDSSMIREPITQMFGMATQMATGARMP